MKWIAVLMLVFAIAAATGLDPDAVVGKLLVASRRPNEVSTAATWTSLCVSTPRTTSSGSDGFGSGMLDMVVRLLTARERMAVVGSAERSGL